MEFMDVIRRRKSTRSYNDADVEEDKLHQLIEAARLAPSWANKQCWKYIIVNDEEKIRKLAAGIINSWMKNVKMVIVACADPKKSGTKNGMEYYLVDVGISMEHLVLAATNLGLGTCWIGGFDEKRVKELLNIPETIKVVAMTPVGYPSDDGVRNKIARKIIRANSRKPLEKMIQYNKWSD
jgi:nitroreductase